MTILGIIILIIVGIIVYNLLKELLVFLLKAIIVIVAIAIALFLIVRFAPTSLYVVGALLIIALLGFGIYKLVNVIKKKINRKNEIKTIKTWMSNRSELYTEKYLINLILTEIDKVKEYFSFDEMYSYGEVPYGRANAFLNLFGKNIGSEEYLFMGIHRGNNYKDMQEYGCLYTNRGIYVIDEGRKKTCIDFDRLYNAYYHRGTTWFEFTFINANTYSFERKSIFLECTDLSEGEGACIYNVADKVIAYGVNKALFNHSVVNEKQYQNIVDAIIQDKMAYLDILRLFDLNKCSGEIYTLGQGLEFNKKELKKHLYGSQGHGYAAEYANNTIDRIMGRCVENAAQNLDARGRQIKNGADRIVDGVAIQTKYCHNKNTFFGSIIENGRLKYLNEDHTPMQIEVPRDKYREYTEAFQKKIDNGEISNIPKGERAEDYIRKGHLTNDQSYMVKHALTYQGIKIDAMQGFLGGKNMAVSNLMIVFAIEKWNGKNVGDAFESAFCESIEGFSHSIAVHVLVQQLSRKEVANLFVRNVLSDGSKAGFAGVSNPIYTLADYIATEMKKSKLAQTEIGKALKLDKSTAYSVVNSSLMFGITYGPDVLKMIEGKISGKQLFKNSVVITASIGVGKFVVDALGLATGGIGTALVSTVAGMFGGYVTKRFLDDYIEDDSVQMFIVLKEEFIDVTMQMRLSQRELEVIVDSTIANDKIADILEEMYASGEERKYAHELVMCTTIAVIAQREKITYSQMINGAATVLCKYIQNFCKEYGLENHAAFNVANVAEVLLEVMGNH